MLKFALMGATGNVGSRTLRESVRRQHQVVAYARSPSRVERLPGVTVIAGDAEDGPALTRAIAGCDAIIVAVTGPFRDTSFAQRTVPIVVKAAQDAAVKRFILVSAFGAGDTAARASFLAKSIYSTVLKRFLDDKAAADRIVVASELDWTIAYPINLKGGRPFAHWSSIPISTVGRVAGLPTLPYENLAMTLVSLANDDSTIGQRMLVTKSSGWRPADGSGGRIVLDDRECR